MSDISYVSLIFVDDVYSNWVCKPGQGGIGKQLSNDIQNVKFELCKRECEEYTGCHGIDYSYTLQNCRMYEANIPRNDLGAPGDYQYCDLDPNDRQSMDFVKLIFRIIFFLMLKIIGNKNITTPVEQIYYFYL